MSKVENPSEAGDQLPDEKEEEEATVFETDRDAAYKVVITSDGELDTSLLVRTSGWIHKKGGSVNEGGFGGRRNWKRRWFVLVPVPFGGHIGYELQYFDRPNGKLKGTVGLSETEIFCEERNRLRRVRYEFQIQLQNGNRFNLGCESEIEREEWIQTLNMVIAFLRKISSSDELGIDGYDPALEDNEDIYKLGDIVAQQCQAYGAGLFGAEAGLPGKFSVHVHDINAVPLSRGGTPLTATISNDEALYYLRIKDNQDGTYAAHYIICQPGIYQLHIRLNDEHDIFGSPFELNIMPSKTIPEKCQAEGEALRQVRPGVLSSFTIIARDVFGNPKTRGGEPFEVGVMGPATMKALRDNNNGTYTCFFEAQSVSEVSYLAAASAMLLVTLHGKHIQGSPFCPTILDAPEVVPTRTPAIAPSSNANSTPQPAATTGGSVRGSSIVSDDGSKTSRMSRQELLNTPGVSAVGAGSNSSASLPAATARVAPASLTTVTPAKTASFAAPPAPSPSANISASGGMSKLERARQRALLAKSLADSGTGSVSSGQYETLLPPPPPPPSSQPPIDQGGILSPGAGNDPTDLSLRLSKLEALNKGTKSALTGSKLNSLGARLEAVKLQQGGNVGSPAGRADRSLLPQSSASNAPKLSFDPVSIVSVLRMGLVGPQPPTLVPDEVAMWAIGHAALLLPEVINLLSPHFAALKAAYDWLAEDVEGTKVVKLTNNVGGGMACLLESYDIIPAYLSKKEAKMAYFVVLSAQRNAGTVPGQAGSVGLDFASFLKFLTLVSIHSLSKASTFSVMYSTTESKVDVMLRRWGLADVNKLEIVKSKVARR